MYSDNVMAVVEIDSRKFFYFQLLIEYFLSCLNLVIDKFFVILLKKISSTVHIKNIWIIDKLFFNILGDQS
jgi:hypothetical protein